MKNRSMLLALLLTLVTGVEQVSAQSTGIKAAYLKDNDLFTIGANGEQQRLTSDGIPKDHPLWSRNGTEIAFLRGIDKATALGNLVVVDSETGETQANILIRPVTPGESNDLRYIKGIEWLTGDEIALTGSINPSTVDTIVIDTKTGKELTDYPDDGGGVAFTPDGVHAASLTGSPHFSPESEREPELDIDNKRVYPVEGVHVTFLSGPGWSEDSRMLAVVAEDYQTKRRSIVVCELQGGCESTALSTPKSSPDDRFKVRWSGGRTFITFPEEAWSSRLGTPTEETWSCQRGDSMAVASSPLPNLQAIADGVTLSLQKKIQKSGGKNPDFWCSDCVLAKLPPKTPKW